MHPKYEFSGQCQNRVFLEGREEVFESKEQ